MELKSAPPSMIVSLSRLALGLLFAVSGLDGATSVAQETYSTREMVQLSPRDADKIVRRDLLSVLRPISHQVSAGNRIQLRTVGLSTEAYGTSFPGLCRRDELWVKYAPVSYEAKPREQPLQPYGFESHARFHAIRSLGAEVLGATARDAIWSDACQALSDDEDVEWFEAQDTKGAARAVNLFEKAINAIRTGTLAPEACHPLPKDTQRTCAAWVLEASDLRHIEAADSCPADPGLECFAFYLPNSTVLTIMGEINKDGVAPDRVKSVSVDEYVIVT